MTTEHSAAGYRFLMSEFMRAGCTSACASYIIVFIDARSRFFIYGDWAANKMLYRIHELSPHLSYVCCFFVYIATKRMDPKLQTIYSNAHYKRHHHQLWPISRITIPPLEILLRCVVFAICARFAFPIVRATRKPRARAQFTNRNAYAYNFLAFFARVNTQWHCSRKLYWIYVFMCTL